MDLVVLDEKTLPFAPRALRDLVGSNGTITPAERRLIEVVAELCWCETGSRRSSDEDDAGPSSFAGRCAW